MTLVYFWPSLVFVGAGLLAMFATLLSVNLVLGLMAFALYSLFPKDILFDTLFQKLRIPAVEENLQETFQLHVKDPLPPSPCLFVWQPHGLVSISSLFYNSGLLTSPGYARNHTVLISFWHYIPILGDFARHLRSIPSDAKSIRSTLTHRESVSVMLGGVHEMIESHPTHIQIPHRAGIYRIALETGTPLVPVLTYGENERFPKGEHWVFEAINGWLYSNFRMGIPFPSWEAVKNWSALSYKPLKPIHSYTGKPIQVEKIENPTDGDIDALRKRYIEGVQALFKETAPPEYSLEILSS
jgi:2-acylglycerol O-acyltransferase 2